MYNPFYIIFRILSGDRLRKATPAESNHSSGFLALIGVYFSVVAGLMKYDRHFFDVLDTFNPVVLWAVVTVFMSVFCFTCFWWGRHVPSKVSYTLAAILWPTLFILAFTGKIE